MYLLDTNAVSELRKASCGRTDPNVVGFFSSVAASELFLSPVTLMEIKRGILPLERRDAKQSAVLRDWVSGHLLPVFARRILPINAAVALSCARLHVPNPCSANDAWIAATALVHGMTVVTRNVGDFASTGVPLLNPWDFIA